MTDELVAIGKPPSLPVHASGQFRKNSVVSVLEAEAGHLGPLRPVHLSFHLYSPNLVLYSILMNCIVCARSCPRSIPISVPMTLWCMILSRCTAWTIACRACSSSRARRPPPRSLAGASRFGRALAPAPDLEWPDRRYAWPCSVFQ